MKRLPAAAVAAGVVLVVSVGKWRAQEGERSVGNLHPAAAGRTGRRWGPELGTFG